MAVSDQTDTGWLPDLTASSLQAFLIYVCSTFAVLWIFYYAATRAVDRTQFAVLELAALGVIFYLDRVEVDPSTWPEYGKNLVSLVSILGLTGGCAYVFLSYDRWLNVASVRFMYTDLDLFVGGLLMAIVIHGTLRSFGREIAVVVIASIIYAVAGPLFPGLFGHAGLSVEEVIFFNTISLEGVLGFVLGVGLSWVAIFIFFAGIFETYGGMEYLMDIGRKVSSTLQKSVAYIAVTTSMLVGSITGSAIANVATTGSFTIPMMKDNGIEGKKAGAVESLASTGSQVLPPVMGTASFLMAEILGIPYAIVLQGAILPALLFYLPLLFAVYLLERKHGWGSADITDLYEDSDPPDFWARVTNAVVYSTPLFVLIYLLVVAEYNPLIAGFYTTLVTIGVGIIQAATDGLSLWTIPRWVKRTLEGFKTGAENMAPLAMAVASLGIVIKLIGQTGFAPRFSTQIVALAGGSLVLLAILIMVTSIIFGMGLPTIAAYVTVAFIAAPVLVNMGIQPLNAHLFVFYFALLSAITPPVAVSCAVAAGIADDGFWGVAFETVRIGLYAFVVPFVLLASSELVIWNGVSTVIAFLYALVGLAFCLIGMIGADLTGRISIPVRGVYLALAGIVLFVPDPRIKLLGVALGLGVGVLRKLHPTILATEVAD